MANVCWVAPSSDDCDRTRTEDRRDAGDLCCRLPLVACGAVLRRRPEVDLELYRGPRVMAGVVQARRPEHFQHVQVVRHEFGTEACDTPHPRVLCQALEQQGRDSVAMVGAGDDETSLRSWCRQFGAVVTRQPDQLVRHDRNEGHPNAVIHLAEARRLGEAEGRMRQEQVPVNRVRRQAGVKTGQRRRIRRLDRTDNDRCAVHEQAVELPRRWIARRYRSVMGGGVRSHHRCLLRTRIIAVSA